MNQKIEYVNFSKLLPNNIFIFILGFISGSQIQIFDGANALSPFRQNQLTATLLQLLLQHATG